MEPKGDIQGLFDRPISLDELNWGMGPRIWGVRADLPLLLQAMAKSPEYTEREFFLLPGLLIKWYYIYGRFPKSDSWVWTWFPHGQVWLDAVKRFGGAAIGKLTSKYYYALEDHDTSDSRRSAFYRTTNKGSNSTIGRVELIAGEFRDSQIVDVERNIDESSIRKHSHAVFYQVYADSEAGILREQIRAVTNSAMSRLQTIPVFFSIVGTRNGTEFADVTAKGKQRELVLEEEVTRMCLDEAKSNEARGPSLGIQCLPLPHFSNARYEGETLRQLHRYCQHHPSNTVSYIQSDLPSYLRVSFRDRQQRDNLLMHLSHAALSSQCIEAVQKQPSKESTSCNVCGLIFYKLWTMFYPGNMFAASCEYVNQLLSPSLFETRTADYTKLALLTRLRWNLQSNLYKGATAHNMRESVEERLDTNGIDRLEIWGIDRYSVNYWITSHPALNPCDLSNDETHHLMYWRLVPPASVGSGVHKQDERVELQQVLYGRKAKLAPSHEGSPLFFNATAYHIVLSDPAYRIREISFLGGHLLRWYFLYNRGPSLSSRMWSWFPDGTLWKTGMIEHGSDVVQILTEPYVNFTT
jgi:hypothetical protein